VILTEKTRAADPAEDCLLTALHEDFKRANGYSDSGLEISRKRAALEQVLIPEERYARMRNVWFVPTPNALLTWLGRCGFRGARVLDVTPTTGREQRSTDWMRFQSLADFLDTADPARTVEGLPAPQRGIFIAEAA